MSSAASSARLRTSVSKTKGGPKSLESRRSFDGRSFDTPQLDLAALSSQLKETVADDFFQPEAQFKPLMHVVEVLADETLEAVPVPSAGAEEAGAPLETWLSVRTLAGKTLPLPGVGPGDTVGAVAAALERLYGVKCAVVPGGGGGEPANAGAAAAAGRGAAGLYCDGVGLRDSAQRLRDLPLAQPPRTAALLLQNAAYEDIQRQVSTSGSGRHLPGRGGGSHRVHTLVFTRCLPSSPVHP